MPLLVETEADPKAGHAFEPCNDMHPPLLCADATRGMRVNRVSAAAPRAIERFMEGVWPLLACR